jgi:hypothetical protein
MAASLGAKGKGKSILDDDAFAASLSRMSAASSKAMYAHAGRLLLVARAYMDEGEYAEIAPFAHLMDRLVMCFLTDERNEEFRMTTAITGIPDISGVIEQMAAMHMGGHQHRAPRTAGAAAPGDMPIVPSERKQKAEAQRKPAPPTPPTPPATPTKNKPAAPSTPAAPSASSDASRGVSPADATGRDRPGISFSVNWSTEQESPETSERFEVEVGSLVEPRSYDWQTREPAWSEETYTLESGTLVVR